MYDDSVLAAAEVVAVIILVVVLVVVTPLLLRVCFLAFLLWAGCLLMTLFTANLNLNHHTKVAYANMVTAIANT